MPGVFLICFIVGIIGGIYGIGGGCNHCTFLCRIFPSSGSCGRRCLSHGNFRNFNRRCYCISGEINVFIMFFFDCILRIEYSPGLSPQCEFSNFHFLSKKYPILLFRYQIPERSQNFFLKFAICLYIIFIDPSKISENKTSTAK